MSTELIELDPQSPTGILGVDKAHLPAVYERAVEFARKCQDIDEAKEWSTKAEALAAYAKMKGRKELEQLGRQLRQTWTRRYGELSLQIAKHGGDRKSEAAKIKKPMGHLDLAKEVTPRFKRKAAAFAKVPEPVFNDRVKAGTSDRKISSLGAQPRRAKPERKPDDPKSKEYQAAGRLLELLRHARDEAKAIAVPKAVAGLSAGERAKAAKLAKEAVDWLMWVAAQLEGAK